MKATLIILFIILVTFTNCRTTAFINRVDGKRLLLEPVSIDNCVKQQFSLPKKIVKGFRREFGVNLREVTITDENVVSSDLLSETSLNKKFILSCECDTHVKFVLYEKRSTARTQDVAVWRKLDNKEYELKLLTMKDRHYNLESFLSAIRQNRFWEAPAISF